MLLMYVPLDTGGDGVVTMIDVFSFAEQATARVRKASLSGSGQSLPTPENVIRDPGESEALPVLASRRGRSWSQGPERRQK